MIQVDLSKDAGKHEIHSFCDGDAVEIKANSTLYSFVRRQVNALFSLKECADFPASRPTVLSHETLARIAFIEKQFHEKKKKNLSSSPFYVTEKTDGRRVYLYFFSTYDYRHKLQVVIDSRYNMHLVFFEVPNEFYEGTLLDGELVQDQDQDQDGKDPGDKNLGRKKYVFYVFDCLQSMGTPVHKQWFWDRLLIATKLAAMISLTKKSLATSPFEIKVKTFYSLREIRILLKKMSGSPILHPSDGLIINQNEAHTSCFHCPYTHKWKSLEYTTVDFLLVCLVEKDSEKCCFFTKKNTKVVLRQKMEETLKDCSHTCEEGGNLNFMHRDRYCSRVLAVPRQHLHLQIVECFYCPHDKLWKPKKLRKDKEYPNSLHVLRETVKIMKKPIYLSVLVKTFES